MDRASAIIMGFLGVVLLSIAALFWVLTSDNADNNEAASLLQTRSTPAVGVAGAPARSTPSAVVRTTRAPNPTSTTASDGSSNPTVTPAAIPPSLNAPTSTSPTSTSPTGAVASPELVAVLGRVEAGGIRFEYRSDDLSPSAMSLLDELAVRLQRESAVRLSISGHTDAEGAPADNAALSARRATAVMEHLMARGVAAGRLEIRAAGHLEPVADNESESGRSANRRVEIELLGMGR